jgi:hypothetical protein
MEYRDNVSHTRVIEYDGETRTKKLFHWNASDGTFSIETVTDVEDIIEQNKLEKNNINTKSWKGDIHKVASLPLMIWMKLRQSGCLQDPKCMRKFLLDPENRHFLTRDHF